MVSRPVAGRSARCRPGGYPVVSRRAPCRPMAPPLVVSPRVVSPRGVSPRGVSPRAAWQPVESRPVVSRQAVSRPGISPSATWRRAAWRQWPATSLVRPRSRCARTRGATMQGSARTAPRPPESGSAPSCRATQAGQFCGPRHSSSDSDAPWGSAARHHRQCTGPTPRRPSCGVRGHRDALQQRWPHPREPDARFSAARRDAQARPRTIGSMSHCRRSGRPTRHRRPARRGIPSFRTPHSS